MARFNITSLNYIETGSDRSFVNMDIELDYKLYDKIHLLRHEFISCDIDGTKLNDLSDIAIEQGKGNTYNTEYITKEFTAGTDKDHALSKEKIPSDIILNEQQKYFHEIDPSSRDYIQLYLSCCTEEYQTKCREFNRTTSKLNQTYVIENIQNSLTSTGSVNFVHDTDNYNNNVLPIYDINDVAVKSAIKHPSVNSTLVNFDANGHYADIYAPQFVEQPIGFVRDFNGKNVLLLTPQTENQPTMYENTLMSSRFDSINTTFYGMKLTTHKMPTYLYNGNSTDNAISAFTPVFNVQDIRYNYIIDIPKTNSLLTTDYYNGNTVGNLYLGKNTFNAQYTMQMSSQTSLANCRTYAQISHNANIPYVKFYDDVDYELLSVGTSQSNQIQKLKAKQINQSTIEHPFQKIEYINKVGFTNDALHKSFFFSVQIDDGELAVLDNSKLSTQMKNIQQDIRNAIREIVRNVTPANTELFDVKFAE